jgi:hypothetical protein
MQYPTKLEWVVFGVAIVIGFSCYIYFGEAVTNDLKLTVGVLAAFYTVYRYLKKADSSKNLTRY